MTLATGTIFSPVMLCQHSSNDKNIKYKLFVLLFFVSLFSPFSAILYVTVLLNKYFGEQETHTQTKVSLKRMNELKLTNKTKIIMNGNKSMTNVNTNDEIK